MILPSTLSDVQQRLLATPRTWLITGVAGFIGSNLLETLLALDQKVIGVDNLVTGSEANLRDVQDRVGNAWLNFTHVLGDITNLETCREACDGVDIVLHEAALGSVPRSIVDPISTNRANIDGFLNVCLAARDAHVSRVVYASSSSVYGDDDTLPKRELRVGKPLSPYAVTKLCTELYAGVLWRTSRLETVGLRYFNVFGRRQDPNGPYAAVIPRWIAALLRGEPCTIFGDGESSRDFCYIENVIQANLLAAVVPERVGGEVFNIAGGQRTTLNALYDVLRNAAEPFISQRDIPRPIHGPPRPGDVRHSLADIRKAHHVLGYAPSHTVEAGIAETIAWYRNTLSRVEAATDH